MILSEPIDSGKKVEVFVTGLESAGKSQLLGSLTGRFSTAENLRGSTLACERYNDGSLTWFDSPGILRDSESETTRIALRELGSASIVVVVARATRHREELAEMWPLVAGKRGAVVLTFADRLADRTQVEAGALELEKALGVPVIAVDARNLSGVDGKRIRDAVAAPKNFAVPRRLPPPVWPEAPANSSGPPGRIASPLLGLGLLLVPAAIAVWFANASADRFADPLGELMGPLISAVSSGLPPFPGALLTGPYGLLAMFPFLLLYAGPTLVVFALLTSLYKSTGLMDRVAVMTHPWLRPFGIGGRDLVRVVMGFGCNVPAITATRACHSCSRSGCISAISFGSACSYQLPATLAVFAAAGMPWLVLPYLAVMAVGTLVYLRCVTPAVLRRSGNRLLLPVGDTLRRPSWPGVRREVMGTLYQFATLALPVFAVICFVAASLDYFGLIDQLSRGLSPLMALFNLPGEAAPSVVMGSVRKDGIAIGLLDADWNTLKVPLDDAVKVLTAVFLASVLLPCVVTLFTIAREMNRAFAVRLCLRQMIAAVLFSLGIAWGGALLLRLF